MAVAALDRHDHRQAKPPAGQQRRPAGRVTVLRVQQVEGLPGVLDRDRRHHGVDVAFEVAAVLLAELFEADHAHARHSGRRAAAVDPGAEGVAAVLAHHGDVVAGPHEFAQEVRGVDAHARDGREEAAADEADPHASASSRPAGSATLGAARTFWRHRRR